ncbi:aldo/keto reductase [Diplocloster agilis]|uniref:aldo/keto reductase n=1 Tax=Diplocloster agilis TaxID=2850323 RepID=UPI0008212E68|nr:aldo/keto reductase [Suonthocola fibrivorans]MCU6734413.1 aldo/keto reductase [Suonthocola fibrivorans]SCJ38207.1 L-glyceraldehyde 3-phosphate reductase [uncultured Clostridium sp.]
MIANNRYENMSYVKCGDSGLYLPKLCLGIWNNFGKAYPYENSREMILTAFNLGINHIDAANNYGPPPGSAEEVLGEVLRRDLKGYRDELVISTKAGYEMWDGPYGNWGSRKSLMASLDQSLKRMQLDYVDIFYHHRRDENTPLEETMGALADMVRQGKALYVGVSNYNAEDTRKASRMLKDLGVKLLIHQPRYNMFCRIPEQGLFDVLKQEGIGSVAFCPLEQGLLTTKYIAGIPKGSRADNQNCPFLNGEDITAEVLDKVIQLNELAKERGQSLPQMALAWDVREGGVTSVLLGASRKEQIIENVKMLENQKFTADELARIDEILG